ncbi:MAG: CRTAC1 family protein [Planctomycetota bacterium]
MKAVLFGLAGPVLLCPPATAQQFDLVDVTDRAGIDFDRGDGRMGLAIGDIDGDGWQDVAIFGANDETPRIYRNQGAIISAGTDVPWFVDITDQVMPPNDFPTSVGLFADLDNDGDQDLAVGRRGFDPATGEPNHQTGAIAYYENMLDTTGRFEMGASPLRVAHSPSSISTLTAVDQDGDRDLDLFMAYSGVSGNYTASRCFFVRNDGLPNLVDASDTFGIPLWNVARALSAVFADFDGDMLPDLHCAVDFHMDLHGKNMGGGSFLDVSQAVGTTNLGSDMGLAIGDIDNDLDLDIYSTNINVGVLYVNDGTGNFTNEAGARGCLNFNGSTATIGWGTNFVDLDNDQDLDLTMVPTGPGDGHVWMNDGTGHFQQVTTATNVELKGYAIIDFDLDRDGDQDLLYLGSAEALTPRLLLNVSSAMNHWLEVDLEGTLSNRDAIGAQVVVTTPDGTRQMRAVMAAHSYRVGAPKRLHFGLGDQSIVSEIEVRWPSGRVTRRGPFPGDRIIGLIE